MSLKVWCCNVKCTITLNIWMCYCSSHYVFIAPYNETPDLIWLFPIHITFFFIYYGYDRSFWTWIKCKLTNDFFDRMSITPFSLYCLNNSLRIQVLIANSYVNLTKLGGSFVRSLSLVLRASDPTFSTPFRLCLVIVSWLFCSPKRSTSAHPIFHLFFLWNSSIFSLHFLLFIGNDSKPYRALWKCWPV